MVYADDILNREQAKPKTTITDMAAGTMTGAAIGLLGGTLYAFFKKKPYIKCMLIGTVIGGGVSSIFLVKK